MRMFLGQRTLSAPVFRPGKKQSAKIDVNEMVVNLNAVQRD